MSDGSFDGMPDEDRTALGFGGKTIGRRLQIGDELFLLLKCEVVSDGRSRKKDEDNGELTYKAGASTVILAELSASEAAKVAAEYR